MAPSTCRAKPQLLGPTRLQLCVACSRTCKSCLPISACSVAFTSVGKPDERTLPDGKGGRRAYAATPTTNSSSTVSRASDSCRKSASWVMRCARSTGRGSTARSCASHSASRHASQSISPTGRETVYDTTQPDGNAVIFNGLVTGQCGEQPLPPYGCCCLGSINLTRFVIDPFGERAAFDWERFRSVTKVSVRALDNVLDVTLWPLEEQAKEADNKRRIGLGFTGLGNTLTMLGLRYDSEAGAHAGGRHLARDARRRLRGFGRNGAGERRVPAVRRRQVPGRTALRLARARQAESRDSQARHPQLPPAVDCADRHDLAGVRRQCLRRHRADVFVDLHPQEAHAGRQQAGIRRRGLRLSPVQAHGWRREHAAGRDSSAHWR